MKLVMYDTSWMGYRSIFSIGSAVKFKDEPTSVIYGLLDQVRTIALDRRVRSNNVGMFFDSPRSFRREKFPFYKNKPGTKTPEELEQRRVMHEQLNRLHYEILPACGFPCYSQEGLESDDLMAQVAQQNIESVIITADEDLLQCITDQTHWFNPSNKGGYGSYYDTADMIRDKAIGPNDWAYVKCLAGCDSDNVPGIKGVGEKTAIAYIWKMLNPGVKLDSINSAAGLLTVDRNIELVTLPHKYTKPVRVVTPSYKDSVFFGWCEKLGFRSFLEGSQHRDWCNFFSGRMSTLDLQPPKKRAIK